MILRFLVASILFVSPGCWAQLTTVPIPGVPGLTVTLGNSALPLRNINNIPGAINVTMNDDDNKLVPLGFSFPFFGRNFTQSWMHSNGVVSFQNPDITGNFCCSGVDLTVVRASNLNYSIMPLWTDLIVADPGGHWYLPGNNEITYGWYKVNEFGTNNKNSFEVKINSAGLVDIRLQGAIVTWHPVTSGMTGDLALGQYYQFYHGSMWNNQNPQQWTALSGTNDPCINNPLYSTSCNGYAIAYIAQQCSINALSNITCPGYQQAYFNQQCTMNALWNTQCPGYQQAYFNQQCEVNGLYDRNCPNYSRDYAKQQLLSQNKLSTVSVTSNTETTVSSISADPSNLTAPVMLIPTAPIPTAPIPTTAVTVLSATPVGEIRQPQTRAEQLQQAREEDKKRDNAARAPQLQDQIRSARTMEQQVDMQNTIIGAMGYNKAFATYETQVLLDVKFYQDRNLYPIQIPVDNQRARNGLIGPSDRRHQQMLDQQYLERKLQ